MPVVMCSVFVSLKTEARCWTGRREVTGHAYQAWARSSRKRKWCRLVIAFAGLHINVFSDLIFFHPSDLVIWCICTSPSNSIIFTYNFILYHFGMANNKIPEDCCLVWSKPNVQANVMIWAKRKNGERKIYAFFMEWWRITFTVTVFLFCLQII